MESMEVIIRNRHEVQCFGTTLAKFKENAFITNFKEPGDLIMLSMSIQSDCQELIERLPGDMTTGREQLRQWLNLSKWCITEAGRLMRVREAK